MKIDGVKLIEDISIDNCPPKDEDNDCASGMSANTNPWLICVKTVIFQYYVTKVNLVTKKDSYPLVLTKNAQTPFMTPLSKKLITVQKKSFDDLPMPLGKYSNLAYKTIQHDLPENCTNFNLWFANNSNR